MYYKFKGQTHPEVDPHHKEMEGIIVKVSVCTDENGGINLELGLRDALILSDLLNKSLKDLEQQKPDEVGSAKRIINDEYGSIF